MQSFKKAGENCIGNFATEPVEQEHGGRAFSGLNKFIHKETSLLILNKHWCHKAGFLINASLGINMGCMKKPACICSAC